MSWVWQPTPLEVHFGDYLLSTCVALCVLGFSGIVATNWILHARCSERQALQLSAEELSVYTPTVSEGARLHREVPMERWCVTRDDLRQFRRLVQHAVKEGRITPTDCDPFDADDVIVGPSIHTVCSQFIVPVTQHAGEASWALMRHPEGLPCDLFVTHAWTEGVYEFVDKVVHSWPPGSRHAYCCMLSNPQSLDISGLIASPLDSPFARALRRAKHLLVAPNSKVSIYTRIWCAYEAFLGYTWGKLISTASSPVPGFWPRVIRPIFIWITGLGVGGLVVAARQRRNDWYRVFAYVACSLLCLIITIGLCLRACARHKSTAIRCVIFVGSFDYGVIMAGAVAFYCTKAPASVALMLVTGPLICAAAEADRLWAVEAVVQARQLTSGFTGHLRNAECSVPADGDRIRTELVDSGQEAAVDEAVAVLIRTGMCSPHLHEAAIRAGALGNVSVWSMAYVLGGVLAWTVFPLFFLEKEVCLMQWPPRVALMETALWVVLFTCQPRDRRAFTAAGQLLILSCVPLVVPAVFIRGPSATLCACSVSVLTAYGWGPVALVLCMAGPARTARVPLLGPTLVRVLLGVRSQLQVQEPTVQEAGAAPSCQRLRSNRKQDCELGPDEPVVQEFEVTEKEDDYEKNNCESPMTTPHILLSL